jgi:hypothetical protein
LGLGIPKIIQEVKKKSANFGKRRLLTDNPPKNNQKIQTFALNFFLSLINIF